MIRNLSPAKLPGHFWNEDKGLTSLLILLIISTFIIVPFLSGHFLITFFMKLTWLAMLMAGVTSLVSDKRLMRVLLLLPVLFALIGTLANFYPGKRIESIDFIIDLAAFLLLIGMVLVKVFGPGDVTVHRIVGAIVVYMLIGTLWARIYHYVFINVPGSIEFPHRALDEGITMDLFTYFSYTTLTSTGYGDILPAHKITRFLAVSEQLIGVLFPAVLIGRLVSLVVTGSGKEEREKK